MNGVHDMGGMHGMGPIEIEKDEPVFHEPWEGRVFALNVVMRGWKRWNIDAGRHEIEKFAPADYLRWSYYEKWLTRVERLCEKHGFLDPNAAQAEPLLRAENVEATLRRGGPSARELDTKPKYSVGDRVRAKNINPEGHTRLPRYVRGKVGTVVKGHGGHVFPDCNAHFHGEAPQHLYTVRFAARELWGTMAAEKDAVYVDLWEGYLDVA